MDLTQHNKAICRDIFKDTWIRYCAFTNEVGECFRPLINVKLVHLSYVAAFGYVFSDTIYKTYHSYRVYSRQPINSAHKNIILYQSADTLLWHLLASIIIPGFTINRIVKISSIVFNRYVIPNQITKLPILFSKKIDTNMLSKLPTMIGLFSIPFVVHKIDHGVDWVMYRILRPRMMKKFNINEKVF